jgi:Ca2+/H+ antiporter
MQAWLEASTDVLLIPRDGFCQYERLSQRFQESMCLNFSIALRAVIPAADLHSKGGKTTLKLSVRVSIAQLCVYARFLCEYYAK